MKKPTVFVLSGYGLNCEEETAFAFRFAGSAATIVHINDLIERPKELRSCQILAVPGGFAYGDDTGSGNAYAQKLKNHLWEEILRFVEQDRLVIGICNGCQILVNLGLVPAMDKNYGARRVALLPNDTARYTVRWTDVRVENTSPWLAGLDTVSLPIAHGEGKFYADPETLERLTAHKQIALRYVAGDICTFQRLPANPTGTLDDIAGMTDETGRILGLMPHPERAIFFTQLPHWTYLKETYYRNGKRLPKYGQGLRIFQNAVRYYQ